MRARCLSSPCGRRLAAPARAGRVRLPRRAYQTADRASGYSPSNEDDPCSSGGGVEGQQRPHHASLGDVAARLALERLYLAPLEWSRAYQLVTLDGMPAVAAAGGGALAPKEKPLPKPSATACLTCRLR